MRKKYAFIMLICIFFTLLLSGCTSENHRVMVTIKNTTEITKSIEFHVDDKLEISTSLEPKESVEREYELSQGNHVFELYHEVNGTFELYEMRNIPIESDSSVFFELE
jgi:hypothetical protein